ncbi:MAG: glucose-6-phosphate isomerase [Alphaproteobacteria bacterium]
MSEGRRFTQKLYEHHIEDAFESGSVTREAYTSSLQDVKAALGLLKHQGEQGLLPMLETPFWKEDLLQFQAIANAYRKFRYVLVIGTGGATLGGRTLSALLQSWVMSDTHYPNLYFLDNLDSEIFWEIISLVNPATTGVLVISKSGETPETLIQLMRCLEYWEEFLTPEQLGQHITVITEPKPNTLRRIASHYGFQQLDHPPQVGGRFSCFTVASFLPAMIAGVNVKEVRQGAAYLLNQVFSQQTSAPVEGAALIWALHQTGKFPSHVMMPYGNVFIPFSLWHRQLWAESLGKDNKGFTPILSPCPLDQHSQLQLYLAGPKDKFFTFLYERQTARETPRANLWEAFPELKFLAHASISDLVQAEMAATIQVLSQRGCPARTIVVPTLQEISLGALMMHFMLETLLLAQLLKIDPLSQPAVDAGKILAKKFLLNQFAPKTPKKKI